MARRDVNADALRIPTLPGGGGPGGVPMVAEQALPQGVAAIGGLGERIAALSAGLTRRAQQDAEEEAWEAGTVAGEAEPGTEMHGGGRIYRSAYNRAAADSGQRRLEVMARQQLGELAERHATDPAAFSAAAAQWRDGMAGSLPATLAARFRTGFDTLALPAANQIRQAQRRAVADQAVASWTELLPARIAGIEGAAGRALVDPAAAAAYRAQEDQAIAELIALGPPEAFSIGGRLYPADPSRAGALTVTQLAQQSQRIREAGREAVVVGAWREAGGGRQWIDQFEGGAAGALVDRVFRAENPAGDARRNAMGSSASGPGQITDSTWGAYAPRLGLRADQRNDRQAHVAIFNAYMADAEREIGRALSPGESYAAWVLGIGGLKAFLDAGPAADARGTYARAAGEGVASQAFRQNPRLLEPGMTVGQVMTALARRVAGGAAAADGMPLVDNERQRIAARLRSLQASEDAANAERRADARAELARQVQENLAAIATSGQPVRRLDPEIVARAGEDLQRLLERERAATERYAADQVANTTTDPAALAELAASFAPGTPNFTADPAAAVQLRASLARRGVQIAGGALDERVRDLEAEAAGTGRAGEISPDEARAAGVTPERRAEINRAIALTAEISRLRQDAAALPPGQREAALARFPAEGEAARENSLRVRAMAEAFQARDRAVEADPAAFVLARSPALRAMAAEVQQGLAQGDVAALPGFVAAMRAEQARIGVPVAQQRPLPEPMMLAMTAAIADARDPASAAGALRVLTAAVGLEGVLPALASVQGPRAETRREAMAVAAAVGTRDPALARQILAGTQLLREDALPGVSATAIGAAADQELGAAFRAVPAARAQIVSAATALYAAERAAAGKAGGAFDTGAFRAALTRVQPVTRWDGQTLPLPGGMEAGRFQEVLGNLPPAALAGAMAEDGRAITPAMIARGGFELVPVGSGLFELRFGGRQVMRREGGAFRLDVPAAAALPAPSAPPQGRARIGGGGGRITQ